MYHSFCDVREHSLCSYVFDRASLQFTVKLLRQYKPSLALRIQNILGPAENRQPLYDDKFTVQLDSFTLKQVVETVGQAGSELANQVLTTQQGDYSDLQETKDVIGMWLDYARYFMDEQHKVAEPAWSFHPSGH